MTNVAAIGHNNPPSPFGECEAEVAKFYDEAKLWLDGEPVSNEGMAEGVSKLMGELRKAKKRVDAQRVEEKKPHDEAGKAVQAKYKPLLEKCDDAVKVCKKALTPWLEKKEAERQAEIEAKRLAAEAAAAEAEKARKAALESADLKAMEEAQALTRQAEKAGKQVSRAENAKAQATGGERAVSLRTKYVATVVNHTEAARYLWEHRRNEMNAFIDEQIQREVNHGVRDIPGVNIEAERSVA